MDQQWLANAEFAIVRETGVGSIARQLVFSGVIIDASEGVTSRQ